jgi:hypothetical protein
MSGDIEIGESVTRCRIAGRRECVPAAAGARAGNAVVA